MFLLSNVTGRKLLLNKNDRYFSASSDTNVSGMGYFSQFVSAVISLRKDSQHVFFNMYAHF